MNDPHARSSPGANEPPPGLTERLLADAGRVHAKAGRTLMSQGDTSTAAYIVREGFLQVMLFSIDGREIILREIAKGEIFGEIAAVDGQARSATIVALSDCVLASIPADSFCAAINEIPGAWQWLARRLSGQVRDLTSRLLERNALRVASRLHCELLRRCREVSADEDVVYLQPSPTHAQLAAYIGTHREAVTREMRHLVERGILRQQHRCIVVNDTRALARLVQETVGERVQAGDQYRLD